MGGDWFSFCGGVWLSGCFWWVRIIKSSLKNRVGIGASAARRQGGNSISAMLFASLATSCRRSILFIALDTAVGFQAAVKYRKKKVFRLPLGNQHPRQPENLSAR